MDKNIIFTITILAVPFLMGADIVAQTQRAVVLEEQAKEKDNWLKDVRAFTFYKTEFSGTIGVAIQKDVETTLAKHQGIFLTRQELKDLLASVRKTILKSDKTIKSVTSEIQSGVLNISVVH